MARIVDQPDEFGFGIRGVIPSGGEYLAEMGRILNLLAVPLDDSVRGPLCALIIVALVACVRRPELDRQVRPRDADAVVKPFVHPHVRPCRHVAGNALRRFGVLLVEVVLRRVVLVGQMALGAQRIAGGMRFQGMRVVAIGAGDGLVIHLAL